MHIYTPPPLNLGLCVIYMCVSVCGVCVVCVYTCIHVYIHIYIYVSIYKGHQRGCAHRARGLAMLPVQQVPQVDSDSPTLSDGTFSIVFQFLYIFPSHVYVYVYLQPQVSDFVPTACACLCVCGRVRFKLCVGVGWGGFSWYVSYAYGMCHTHGQYVSHTSLILRSTHHVLSFRNGRLFSCIFFLQRVPFSSSVRTQ